MPHQQLRLRGDLPPRRQRSRPPAHRQGRQGEDRLKAEKDVSLRERILAGLRSLPEGRLYTIAPKAYVSRGYEYHRQGRVEELSWNAGSTVLSASVIGKAMYRVDISVHDRALTLECDCPAWTAQSQCKHVVCSLMTIKNLLNPQAFSVAMDQNHRDSLLKVLLGEEPSLEKKRTRKGYAVIIKWSDGLSDVYLEKDGARLSGYGSRRPPRELEIFSSFASPEDKLSYLPSLMKGKAEKYPLILKRDNRETELVYDDQKEYTLRTAMDFSGSRITAHRICLKDDSPVEILPLEEFIILPAEGGIIPLKNSKGWRIWDELLDMVFVSSYYSFSDIPEGDDTAITIPSKSFMEFDFLYPSAEGARPADLITRKDGKEQEPLQARPGYRLTIIPAKGKGQFLLKAESAVNGLVITPARLSRFFTILGAQKGLKTQKRQGIMIQAFFKALSARSVKEANSLIRKKLDTPDFEQKELKRTARALLKDFLALYRKEESQLSLHNGQWISFPLEKRQEFLLSSIPGELFGWEIFRDLPAHLAVTVDSRALYEKLPLLFEMLQQEGIGLVFKGKPVTTAEYDFSFEARRDGIDWFEIRPEIRCNGETIADAAFLDLLGKNGVRETEDSIQIMDSRSLRLCTAIMKVMETSTGTGRERRKKEVTRTPRLAILDWLMLRQEGVTVKLPPEDEEVLGSLASFRKIRKKPLPKGLKAELRPYQRDGYSWLSFLYEHRLGACLADDMGLGKTIQAITLLGAIKEGKLRRSSGTKGSCHLIVLPPSLLYTWEHEIQKFYPGLSIGFYTGKERATAFEGYDVILTTYGIVRRDIEKLKDIGFHVIIFDEAQAVKNILADTTGAVRQLKAEFKLSVTGTPLENHLGEYYSIMDLALPGLLGDYDNFRPLIRQEASPALDMMIRRTKPFVLRRTKAEILDDLPPKTETDIFLELTDHQKALYKRTVEYVRSTIDEAYTRKTQAQAQIIALTAILKLRQICVSPRLLDPKEKEKSPKMEFLVESLQELADEGHSALVFSQFTSLLDIAEEELHKHHIEFIRLDGSTPVQKRKRMVEDFQSGKAPSVFLLSLKAGGQGLTLTRASYVFHLDPWWNPAVENQASDRVHRIGQKEHVTITRLIMRHTIEEKMMELKERKKELYKAVMEGAEGKKTGPLLTRSDFDFLLG